MHPGHATDAPLKHRYCGPWTPPIPIPHHPSYTAHTPRIHPAYTPHKPLSGYSGVCTYPRTVVRLAPPDDRVFDSFTSQLNVITLLRHTSGALRHENG